MTPVPLPRGVLCAERGPGPTAVATAASLPAERGLLSVTEVCRLCAPPPPPPPPLAPATTEPRGVDAADGALEPDLGVATVANDEKTVPGQKG